MFKSPAGQARYFSAYDRTLALWPVPAESFDVPTAFGSTHVHACGPEGAPALVLLHGSAVSSTMWYPNISALSHNYRVFAPDIIGELGKSVRTHPLKGARDYVAWLAEVLDGLGLERAHIAGLSFGGYLAMHFASAAPERVTRLVLMSPAGLYRIRLRFYSRVAAAVFLPVFSSRFKPQEILGMSSPLIDPVIEQLLSSPRDFGYQMVFPSTLKDAELGRIRSATLLLLGDREIIYRPEDAQARARKLIPHLETIVIPEAGHALNFDQPEIVNNHVLHFLAGDPA